MTTSSPFRYFKTSPEISRQKRRQTRNRVRSVIMRTRRMLEDPLGSVALLLDGPFWVIIIRRDVDRITIRITLARADRRNRASARPKCAQV